MRRLFWANVVAVILFTGLAGYHYYRHRTRAVYDVAALMRPIASARTEAEVRKNAETLAQAAQHAHASGGRLYKAMASLALAAACLFLWNAVSMSEFHEVGPGRKD
jgi:hypothetical protein